MRIGIDDILAGHGIGTGGGSGGGRLEPKSARVTTTNVTSVVDVPATLGYDPTKDMMMVFQNSIFIDKGLDYTLSEDASTIIATDGDWTVGTILDFLVITNTKTDLPTYDGSLIGDGTITESKLSQAILDRIEASSNFDAVLGRVNEVELKMRQLREVAANAQLQMEATELVASGQSFGGNGHFSFGAPMDMAKTTTTNILDVGATVLTGKVAKHDAFKVGQTVTIYDDVNTEAVVVTKSTATELEVSALTKGYKSGAVIARSTLVPHVNGGYDYPKWNAAKGPGVGRLNLGITDETIIWATNDIDLNIDVTATFDGMEASSEITSIELKEQLDFSISDVETSTDINLLDNKYLLWQDGMTKRARVVEVDQEGYIYFGYYQPAGNKTVRKLDSTGREVWASTSISNVQDISTDKNGFVYVTNSNKLYKLDSNSNVIWEKSWLNADKVLVDNDGNILLTASVAAGSKVLTKFDSDGNEIWSNTEIGYASDVAVDLSGNIFVTHNRTSGEKTLRKLNSLGTEIWYKNEQNNGWSVEVDRFGNVYAGFGLLSSGAQVLFKYDNNGNKMWSRSDTVYPRAMVTDSLGNLYIACSVSAGSNTIFKYSPTGGFLWSLTDKGDTYGIDIDKAGNLYTAHDLSSGNTISKYTGAGGVIWDRPTTLFLSGVTTDASSNVIVSASGGIGTQILTKYNAEGSELWSKKDGYYASNVATDKEGNIILVCAHNLSDGSKVIRKYDPNGIELWTNGEVPQAVGVDVDKEGNIYVAHKSNAGTKVIRKFSPSGVELWSNSEVGAATSIKVDDIGNVYTTHEGGGVKTIRKFNNAGVELWSKNDIGNGTAVDVDSEGNVYVGYYQWSGSKQFRKLDSQGVEIWSISNISPVQDVKVDSDGIVYIGCKMADTSYPSVYAYDKNGTLLWTKREYGNLHRMFIDREKNLYCAHYQKALRKIGIPKVPKQWLSESDSSGITFRSSIEMPLKIYLKGKLIDEKSANTKHYISLNTEMFDEGDNYMTFELDKFGKEVWKVKRVGSYIQITQWVMSNEEALPLEVELTLTGDGKLHKYIGAIG